MSKVHSGQVLPIEEMSDSQRAEIRAELECLENDLIRRRGKLKYWTLRKHQAETLPDIPEDLRLATLDAYERALNLVQTGERLRALLIAGIQGQPEYAPAYHHQH